MSETATLAAAHTPICPWCGRPVAACPDPAGHDRADRASETTWLRQARGGVAESEPGDWPEPAAPGGEV